MIRALSFAPQRAGCMAARAFVIALIGLLPGCTDDENAAAPGFEVLEFGALPGFGAAQFLPMAQTFVRTCARLMTSGTALARAEDWEPACAGAAPLDTEEAARAWAVKHFLPVRIEDGEVLITGYFEPVYSARKKPEGAFTAPVLTRPDDLVEVDLGAFRPALAGERIAGRVRAGRLEPYDDRAAIEDMPPAGAEAVAYLHADDLFFLQIQGSGVLDFGSGERLAVGYGGQNGHAYHAIGRTLVSEGALDLETVSMQSIRAWLADASPKEAARVRRTNPSYVFFKERGAPAQQGPLGTANVPLTKNVSVAVDQTIIPLGAPLFLSGQNADLDIGGLYVAQDTGGAIKGPGRADIFLGRGPDAAEVAGRMRINGEAAVLLPISAALRLSTRLS